MKAEVRSDRVPSVYREGGGVCCERVDTQRSDDTRYLCFMFHLDAPPCTDDAVIPPPLIIPHFRHYAATTQCAPQDYSYYSMSTSFEYYNIMTTSG